MHKEDDSVEGPSPSRREKLCDRSVRNWSGAATYKSFRRAGNRNGHLLKQERVM